MLSVRGVCGGGVGVGAVRSGERFVVKLRVVVVRCGGGVRI